MAWPGQLTGQPSLLAIRPIHPNTRHSTHSNIRRSNIHYSIRHKTHHNTRPNILSSNTPGLASPGSPARGGGATRAGQSISCILPSFLLE